MEFLVRITVRWPSDGDERQKQVLIRAEGERAAELAAQGMLKRLWRIPGRWASVGLWQVPDAGALHDAIASLPLYPWLETEVEPLAPHPSDPGAASA